MLLITMRLECAVICLNSEVNNGEHSVYLGMKTVLIAILVVLLDVRSCSAHLHGSKVSINAL